MVKFEVHCNGRRAMSSESPHDYHRHDIVVSVLKYAWDLSGDELVEVFEMVVKDGKYAYELQCSFPIRSTK